MDAEDIFSISYADLRTSIEAEVGRLTVEFGKHYADEFADQSVIAAIHTAMNTGCPPHEIAGLVQMALASFDG